MRIESFLRQSPIVQAGRMARRMEASLNAVLATEGLTVFEAMVLAAILFEQKGAVKPSALAESFETTRGNMSHCISSLEAKGLVERRVDPEDARALQLVLRPQGRRRAVRVAGVLDRVQRALEHRLGAAKLETMLGQMRALEAMCEELAQVSTRG